MPTLTHQEIQQRMKDVPGWTLVDGRAIRRQFTFGSFPEAISFVVRIAFHAEDADHHPDITINWKHVALSFTTHSEGGLTEKDFAGAQKADRVGIAD